MNPRDEPPSPAPLRALDRQEADAAGRMFAPSAERNGPELLPLLRELLPTTGTLLEVGAGTGQHAAFFAPRFPGLRWLPTDVDTATFGSIRAWRAAAGATNIAEPSVLDVLAPPAELPQCDAILCVNVLHIAPIEVVAGLMALARRVLSPGGALAIYGPFFRDNEAPPDSNVEFDQRLRSRDPALGVRHVRAVRTAAETAGLAWSGAHAMPVNNTTLVLTAPEGGIGGTTRRG